MKENRLLDYDQGSKSPSYTYQVAWVLIYPLLITLMIEWISRLYLTDTLTWFINNMTSVLLSYSLILAIFLLFYGLSSRLWVASFFSAFPLLILTFLNFFKSNIRGEPLVPWDLFLSKEAVNIAANVSINFSSQQVFFLFTFLFTLILLFFFRKKEIKLAVFSRLSLVFVSIISLFFLYNGIFFNETGLTALNIVDYRWNQEQNYQENGLLNAFSINIKNIIIEKPDNYSLQALEDLINDFSNPVVQALSFEDIDGQPVKKPNIIFIMNESLFDPALLPNVSFSRSPTPNIDKIRLEGTSGQLLVSEYGGGTANTEFEFLTGNKTLYLPKGSMAYQQYVKTPLPAIPAYLKEQGYNTIALHPYQKWFWDRENVYPKLGFDTFYSDEDFDNPEKLTNLISDKSASERVIAEFEGNRQSEAPFFCFLVTMQNHGSYHDKVFSHLDVETSSPLLEEDSRKTLENYVQGVYHADAAYGMLIDYFAGVDEPTVILMFGDHLPSLGDNYDIYTDLGYIESQSLAGEDYLNLFQTPITIYSNDDAIPAQDLGLVDANLLGITVLDKLGFDLPPYWEVLLNGQEAFNQNNYITIDHDGMIIEGTTLESEAHKDKQWLFQYDLLFGEGYMNPYLP